MKTIIAGSRTCKDIKHIKDAVAACGWLPSLVISGTAHGADKLGELYASQNSINVARYPANWDLYGKSAGYKRNEQMAKVADALIAVWDGKSKGTKHMIDIANNLGLKVYIHHIA